MNQQSSPYPEQQAHLASPTTALFASRLTSAETPATPELGKNQMEAKKNNYAHKGPLSDVLETLEKNSHRDEYDSVPEEVGASGRDKPAKRIMIANREKSPSEEESLIDLPEPNETRKRESLPKMHEGQSISNLNKGVLKESEFDSLDEKGPNNKTNQSGYLSKYGLKDPRKTSGEYIVEFSDMYQTEKDIKKVDKEASSYQFTVVKSKSGLENAVIAEPGEIEIEVAEKSNLLSEARKEISKHYKEDKEERIEEHEEDLEESVLEHGRKSVLIAGECEPERVAEEGAINTVALAQEVRVSLPNERRIRMRRNRPRQANNAGNNDNVVEEVDLNGDIALENWINIDSRRVNEDLQTDRWIDVAVENSYYRQLSLIFLEFLLFVEAHLVALDIFQFQILTATAAVIHCLGAVSAVSQIKKSDFRNRKMRWRIIVFIDWMLLVQFYICLTLRLQGVIKNNLYISAVVGYSTIFAYMTFAQPRSFAKTSTIISRALIWTQILLISLKIDSLIDIKWKFAFLIVWVTIALSLTAAIIWAGKVLGLFLTYLNRRGIEGARSVTQPMTIAIANLTLLLVALIFLYLLITFTAYLDGELDKRDSIKITSVVGIAYTFIVFISGLAFKSFVTKMYRLELTGRRLGNRQPLMPPVISFRSEDLKNLVLFVMLSPTYFVGFDDPLLVNQQKDVVKWKHAIMNIKAEKKLKMSIINKPTKKMNLQEMKQWSLKKLVAKEKNAANLTEKPESFRVLETKKIDTTLNEEQKELIDVRLGLSMDDKDIIKDLGKARTTTLGIEIDEGENLCFVCYVRKANAVFMDCGHGGVCVECAQETWTKRNNCMTCRTKIRNIVKYEPIAGMEMVKAVSEIKRHVEFPELNNIII